MPVPETEAEAALISAYDDVIQLADKQEPADGIERFVATGATEENLAWAVQAHERILDRLFG